MTACDKTIFSAHIYSHINNKTTCREVSLEKTKKEKKTSTKKKLYINRNPYTRMRIHTHCSPCHLCPDENSLSAPDGHFEKHLQIIKKVYERTGRG